MKSDIVALFTKKQNFNSQTAVVKNFDEKKKKVSINNYEESYG